VLGITGRAADAVRSLKDQSPTAPFLAVLPTTEIHLLRRALGGELRDIEYETIMTHTAAQAA